MKRCPVIIILIMGWILSIAGVSTVQAQGEELKIGLTLPNEGETFYSGPSTLLYNIPIEGWVESESFSPTQILVEVAIYQDTTLVTHLTISPDSDGIFRIYATVNPGAYTEDFAAEFIPCGDVCHVHPSAQFSRDEWNASLKLPPGPMLLITTATDPAGRIAIAQRTITVDRSGYAVVPVRVEIISEQQVPLQNIPISGATWLYMWRSRFATGGTDENGVAYVQVEALAQAPTTYRFQVLPSVLNGMLYESIAPVEITLPPGATDGSPVTLQVKAQMGKIFGLVKGTVAPSPFYVWVVHQPDGETQKIQVNADGTFMIYNIPLGEYLITVDQDSLAGQGLVTADQKINLAQSLSSVVELELLPLEGYSYRGDILDSEGRRLPFAWINVEKLDIFQAVLPEGHYALHGMPVEKATLVVDAPGYYSQARVVDQKTSSNGESDFKLVRRPETQSIPWGDGEIIVPSETRSSSSGQHIFLERGWLWGYNQNEDNVIIQVGSVEIGLLSGIFALEDVPGQATWFYLLDGSGTITLDGGTNILPIQAGQMIVLGEDSQASVIPYNPVVVRALHSNDRVPVSTTFQPTLMAQIANRLALIGIDIARLITLVTYAIILVSTILLPLIAFYRWSRQKMALKQIEKRIKA